jgi:hypothetical protein
MTQQTPQNPSDSEIGKASSGELLGFVGRALFGDRWKADMAHALEVSVDRIDDWSKNRGRSPQPGIWSDLAVMLHDHERTIPALKAATLEQSLAPLARVYRVRNIEFSIEPAVDGRWPRLKFTNAPYSQSSFWRYAREDERRLPDDTYSGRLEFDGEDGQPFVIQGGLPIFYPANMQRAPVTAMVHEPADFETVIGRNFPPGTNSLVHRELTEEDRLDLQRRLDTFTRQQALKRAAIHTDGHRLGISIPGALRADHVAALQNFLDAETARLNGVTSQSDGMQREVTSGPRPIRPR